METSVRVISSRPSSSEEDRLQRFRVMLQQTGGDPSAVLDLLATIVRNKDWRRLTDRSNGSQTFLGYFAELGWSKDDLLCFVGNMHHRHERFPNVLLEVQAEMEELRRQVRDLANPKLLSVGPPSGSHNNPSGTGTEKTEDCPAEPNVDNSNIRSEPKGGTTSSYLTRRLKRDHPELAEKVINGDLKPYAAARQAGIVQPTITLPLDPTRASRLLVKHFQGDQLADLLRTVANHAGYDLVPREDA